MYVSHLSLTDFRSYPQVELPLSRGITTLLGLYIAFNYPRRRKGFVIALGLGVVVPLALMAF